MKWTIIPVVVALAVAPAAYAKKVDPCPGRLPSDVVSAKQDFDYCVKGNACDANLNQQVFDNAEGRLPRAGNGQTYYEGRVGQDRAGGAGNRRLVYLLIGNGPGGNTQIANRYFTDDHYATFCEIQ
jgi:guanyl-specific ribonuclease Sa